MQDCLGLIRLERWVKMVYEDCYWCQERNYYWLSLQLPTSYFYSHYCGFPKLSLNRQWSNFHFARQKNSSTHEHWTRTIFLAESWMIKTASETQNSFALLQQCSMKLHKKKNKKKIKNTHWLLCKTDKWVTQELICGLDWNELVVLCPESLGQCTLCVFGFKCWHNKPWPLRNDLGREHQHSINIPPPHPPPQTHTPEYKHYTLVWLHA